MEVVGGRNKYKVFVVFEPATKNHKTTPIKNQKMDTFQQVLALQTKVHDQVNRQNLRLATETQLDALKLAQGLDNPKLMALLYQNLGQILEQKGDIQKTVYAYEAAFKALNEEDHQLEMTSRRLRQATKSFQRATTIEIPDVYSPAVAESL